MQGIHILLLHRFQLVSDWKPLTYHHTASPVDTIGRPLPGLRMEIDLTASILAKQSVGELMVVNDCTLVAQQKHSADSQSTLGLLQCWNIQRKIALHYMSRIVLHQMT